jgi:glycosyltransferase involved in cell wall biosynthesis
MDIRSPVITVLMATKNRLNNLKVTLRSIENQSFKDYELIIVDDASTDGTNRFLKEYKTNKPNIVVISNTSTMGLAHNRNIGIKLARGQYFTFIDDDDCLLPNALKDYNQAVKNMNDGNNFFLIGGFRRLHFKKFVDYVHVFNDSLKTAFINGLTPPVAGQFYPTKLLREIGGYNPEIKSGVDHDLWIRLLSLNPIIYSVKSAISMPNCGPKVNNRMTLDFEYRLTEIQNNLITWNPNLKLVSLYFYEHFKISYEYYLSKVQNNRNYMLKFFRINRKFILHEIKILYDKIFRLICIMIQSIIGKGIIKIKIYSFPKFRLPKD